MKKILGRGLESLIPGTGHDALNKLGGTNISKIQISKIKPNRYQPRKDFNDATLYELAESIKSNGLIQPIVVSHDPSIDKYEIIAGERRFRASQIAGLSEISAILKNNISDKERTILALVENIQREDLNAVDKARGYKTLMDQFNMSQQDLVNYCGKSKGAISNTLRILSLSEGILKALKSNLISEGHAKALLAIKDEKQREDICDKAIKKGLSVREIEIIAQRNEMNISNIKKTSTHSNEKKPDILDMENKLSHKLDAKVEFIGRNEYKSGKMVIHYNSLDHLESIIEKF